MELTPYNIDGWRDDIEGHRERISAMLASIGVWSMRHRNQIVLMDPDRTLEPLPAIRRCVLTSRAMESAGFQMVKTTRGKIAPCAMPPAMSSAVLKAGEWQGLSLLTRWHIDATFDAKAMGWSNVQPCAEPAHCGKMVVGRIYGMPMCLREFNKSWESRCTSPPVRGQTGMPYHLHGPLCPEEVGPGPCLEVSCGGMEFSPVSRGSDSYYWNPRFRLTGNQGELGPHGKTISLWADKMFRGKSLEETLDSGGSFREFRALAKS